VAAQYELLNKDFVVEFLCFMEKISDSNFESVIKTSIIDKNKTGKTRRGKNLTLV